MPVQNIWQEKNRRICKSLNWFKGVTFTFWIKIDRKNIFPKINSKIYKFSVFFPARSSDTGTAGTGIEILGSCSAHPLEHPSWQWDHCAEGLRISRKLAGQIWVLYFLWPPPPIMPKVLNCSIFGNFQCLLTKIVADNIVSWKSLSNARHQLDWI